MQCNCCQKASIWYRLAADPQMITSRYLPWEIIYLYPQLSLLIQVMDGIAETKRQVLADYGQSY